MPGLDGTGPLGYGSGTGRGLGPCGGGMAWGRGRGLGWRRYGGYIPNKWGYAPYQRNLTKKEESEILENEVGLLEEELKAAKARIKEIKG